jgi:hypothetical protein
MYICGIARIPEYEIFHSAIFFFVSCEKGPLCAGSYAMMIRGHDLG